MPSSWERDQLAHRAPQIINKKMEGNGKGGAEEGWKEIEQESGCTSEVQSKSW